MRYSHSFPGTAVCAATLKQGLPEQGPAGSCPELRLALEGSTGCGEGKMGADTGWLGPEPALSSLTVSGEQDRNL